MDIIVNGERRDVAAGTTLAALLAHIGIRPDGTAVARNDEVVARTAHERTLLQDGDRLEIIVAVAGG